MRPITVGLDGSAESRSAADWAAGEAARRNLPLHLLHAWMLPPAEARSAQEPLVRKDWGMRLLRDAKADLTDRYPELSVTAEQVSETPIEALLARSGSSEMLVLGSRGHGVVVGFLLGSLGLHILLRADGPVVMVRHRAGPHAGEPGRTGEAGRAGGEVVVGINDLGAAAEELLEFAFAGAAARGATVRAVRAWSPPPLFAHRPEALRDKGHEGELEARERRALAEAVHPWREKYPDLPVVEHVETGSATDVVLSAAGNADLLVLGRPVHRPHTAPRLGHVAHAALHHAPCPVTIVPHD
ncbi:universal stress protein [Streptomyces sp. NPDC047108]|uniref:universal stress protein n=1 Tax=Streptomyces sp. NPDC047108 TaxID=3155025 RepID=UPI0033D07CE6